jgi:hypothetical protein
MAIYGPSASELNLYRLYEDERINLFGQQIDYYVLNRGANVDPVYNEPTPEWNFHQYGMIAAVTYQEMDNRDPSVRDEGFDIDYDAEVYLSYNEWSRVVGEKVPKEGDVLFAMNEYFDVVNAGKGGNFIDTVKVVGYKILVKKRSKFTPERKFTSEMP